MAKDFYQVLRLKRDADEKAIKGAYRKLAREQPTDAGPNDAGAGRQKAARQSCLAALDVTN